MSTRLIVFALALTALAACGRSSPPSSSEAIAVEAQTPPIDPLAAALEGSTSRWLEAHYPGREFTFSELQTSQASGQKKLCGVWTYAGDSKWREYFITSSDGVRRFGEKPAAIWEENCANGTPLK